MSVGCRVWDKLVPVLCLCTKQYTRVSIPVDLCVELEMSHMADIRTAVERSGELERMREQLIAMETRLKEQEEAGKKEVKELTRSAHTRTHVHASARVKLSG